MKKWGDLPFTVKDSLFSFVPVYSALDVGGGLQQITYNDVFKAYSPVSPPSVPKNVRATNFMSNPTESGIANELHVQITKRNATFLLREMLGLEPIFTCGYTCNNPSLDFGIAGTNTICNGASTFNLVNASGLTPLWFKSENLTYVSGQSTPSYTVNAAANGQGWIKARVNSDCGMVEQTLYLQVGAITNADYSINAPASGCAYQPITFRATSLAGATYDWYWPNDWVYVSGQYGNTLTLQAPLNAKNVEVGVYMANACGPAGLPATFYVSSEDCGTYALAFFPNPTSSRLSIELQEDNLTEKQIQEVEILDAAGAPIKKWRGQSKKAELDVSNLPKGFCYARVNVGGKVTTARIQIK